MNLSANTLGHVELTISREEFLGARTPGGLDSSSHGKIEKWCRDAAAADLWFEKVMQRFIYPGMRCLVNLELDDLPATLVIRISLETA